MTTETREAAIRALDSSLGQIHCPCWPHKTPTNGVEWELVNERVVAILALFDLTEASR